MGGGARASPGGASSTKKQEPETAEPYATWNQAAMWKHLGVRLETCSGTPCAPCAAWGCASNKKRCGTPKCGFHAGHLGNHGALHLPSEWWQEGGGVGSEWVAEEGQSQTWLGWVRAVQGQLLMQADCKLQVKVKQAGGGGTTWQCWQADEGGAGGGPTKGRALEATLEEPEVGRHSTVP